MKVDWSMLAREMGTLIDSQSEIAQAQVSEAEMRSFLMPPARGYDFTPR
jgi:hypothetical protein